MEVGAHREKVIIALLIYKFGEEHVEVDIPANEHEVDVKLFGEPVSIKTITAKNVGPFKLIWTVDAQKAINFMETYTPASDILFVHVNWGSKGGFYYIPLEAQRDVFESIGREGYIKLPKAGTNPRGVEISKKAVELLLTHEQVRAIDIEWRREQVRYDPYARWVEYWKENL